MDKAFTLASDLHNAVAAVCPVEGVSIGRRDDRTSWACQFSEGATDKQRKAAAAVIKNFVQPD